MFEALEHLIRHITVDLQEHLMELYCLLIKKQYEKTIRISSYQIRKV